MSDASPPDTALAAAGVAGVSAVDAVRQALARLPATPVYEHPTIFDEVQRLLTGALEPQANEAPHGP